MYLEHAEIGESEQSLTIVDHVVSNYFKNKDVMAIMGDIRELYRMGDKKSLFALKNFSTRYEVYESLAPKLGLDVNLIRKVRPMLLNLATEYVRILEGTTKQGRKKHLRIV